MGTARLPAPAHQARPGPYLGGPCGCAAARRLSTGCTTRWVVHQGYTPLAALVALALAAAARAQPFPVGTQLQPSPWYVVGTADSLVTADALVYFDPSGRGPQALEVVTSGRATVWLYQLNAAGTITRRWGPRIVTTYCWHADLLARIRQPVHAVHVIDLAGQCLLTASNTGSPGQNGPRPPGPGEDPDEPENPPGGGGSI